MQQKFGSSWILLLALFWWCILGQAFSFFFFSVGDQLLHTEDIIMARRMNDRQKKMTFNAQNGLGTAAARAALCAAFLPVSKHWPGCRCLGSLTWAMMLGHAIADEGCTDIIRVCTGRKILCRTGDSNPRQYCAWLFGRTLYPLIRCYFKQHATMEKRKKLKTLHLKKPRIYYCKVQYLVHGIIGENLSFYWTIKKK